LLVAVVAGVAGVVVKSIVAALGVVAALAV